MPLRRILEHCVILAYLAVTLSAFVYTMTRWRVPLIPWPVLHYSYGMMAPYQGYKTENFDLLAEGRKGDTWESIDLDPSYPMILGNQVMYRRLRSFHAQGEEVSRRKYGELAERILQRERERGRSYAAVRLTWQQWPSSPLGYEARRGEARNFPLTEAP